MAGDLVIARRAGDLVIARRAGDLVIARRAGDLVIARRVLPTKQSSPENKYLILDCFVGSTLPRNDEICVPPRNDELRE
jgi:hypothetical protein